MTFFDDDGGLPGAAVCFYAVASIPTDTAGSFVTTLSPACNLSPGPKWVSVEANMNFLGGRPVGLGDEDGRVQQPRRLAEPGRRIRLPCPTLGTARDRVQPTIRR